MKCEIAFAKARPNTKARDTIKDQGLASARKRRYEEPATADHHLAPAAIATLQKAASSAAFISLRAPACCRLTSTRLMDGRAYRPGAHEEGMTISASLSPMRLPGSTSGGLADRQARMPSTVSPPLARVNSGAPCRAHAQVRRASSRRARRTCSSTTSSISGASVAQRRQPSLAPLANLFERLNDGVQVGSAKYFRSMCARLPIAPPAATYAAPMNFPARRSGRANFEPAAPSAGLFAGGAQVGQPAAMAEGTVDGVRRSAPAIRPRGSGQETSHHRRPGTGR